MALPKDMGTVVVRIREDTRLPSDADMPMRFICKLPCKEQLQSQSQQQLDGAILAAINDSLSSSSLLSGSGGGSSSGGGGGGGGGVSTTTTSIIYTAVDGGKVALPCNIIPPTIDDHVVLILWYKDDEFEPIYTIDARKDPLEKARIIASPNLIDRVYFNQHNQPAFLQIDPVQTKDAGEYRCRVDFKKARTVNIVIQLKVIVPPEEPIISYKYSQSTSHPLKGLIGPFNEGDRLVLVCTSFGGKPRPTLTWWKDYSIIDDSFEYKSKDVTTNELVIESLARHHLLSIFTCQSSNNNITIASSASITIDLNLKPLEIKIHQISSSLLANNDAKFECKSFGSKPKARLYWMFDNVRYDTTLQGDMQTISIISLPLKRENNGHILSCHAENPKIFNSTISEHFVLSVEYVPELTLQLGTTTISLNTIQEGNDIYFDCILDANPMPTTPLIWRFNDEILEPRQGIIQSNYSLVLQNVRRHMSGDYKCEATNQHGTRTSNSIILNIRFAPYCKFKSTLAYGLSLFESNALVCEVDSNPMPSSFQWKFEKQIELTTVHSYNYSSLLYYMPNSTHHYGTIECIAKNDVGMQQIPCKYHIIDSGPPNFPFYCQLYNQSIDKITIKCTSENDYQIISNDNVDDDGDGDNDDDDDEQQPKHKQYLSSSEMTIDNQYNHQQQQQQQQQQQSAKIGQTIFVHPTTHYIAEIYDKHGQLLQNLTLNPPMPFSNISTLINQTRKTSSTSMTMFNFQIDHLIESSNYKIKIYALNTKGTSDHRWINAQTLRKAEKYIYNNSKNFTTDTTGLLFTNYAMNHIKIIMVSVCGSLTIMLIVIVIAISNLLAGFSAKDNKSNMELLSLDLYSMNPAIAHGGHHTGHHHHNHHHHLNNKGPPDLIPTFYYNPSTSTNSDDCTTIADTDRTDLMSSINT
ncbi:hemicentin-2-like isoform x1 [Dermatophagoides farinae]|uniref:Hemicentin-2-like isoform x1 n=1 Tax=Dermatophagoides farinae TaxID=6954 RepID=A0A9D4NTT4_DERFA|nr:hemicentin-2-like isoform x1 [Dermatophagoides farinae]